MTQKAKHEKKYGTSAVVITITASLVAIAGLITLALTDEAQNGTNVLLAMGGLLIGLGTPLTAIAAARNIKDSYRDGTLFLGLTITSVGGFAVAAGSIIPLYVELDSLGLFPWSR